MNPSNRRVLSIDAVRGLTIAGMILVNNPGSWSHIYPPLRHAPWNGCTPTDLVFPFFLFLVGVSMWFSLKKRRGAGDSRSSIFAHVVRRSVILICLGLCMYGFPDFRLIGPFVLTIIGASLLMGGNSGDSPSQSPGAKRLAGGMILVGAAIYCRLDYGYFDQTNLRVPGVLQRIGLCYLLASVFVLAFGLRGVAVGMLVLVVGYAILLSTVSPPDGYTNEVTGPDGLLHDWIDTTILGDHLYRERPDPEGLLSSLGGVATVLFGVMAGWWLGSERSSGQKTIGLFVAANAALMIGLIMDFAYPINKKIWSPSYVVYTGGLALHVIAMCYWLIDVRGYRSWAQPFLVFGSNAIVVFVASSLVAKMLGRWRIGDASIKLWAYDQIVAAVGHATFASLVYAVAYVSVWLLLMVPLYRRRWFVRI